MPAKYLAAGEACEQEMLQPIGRQASRIVIPRRPEGSDECVKMLGLCNAQRIKNGLYQLRLLAGYFHDLAEILPVLLESARDILELPSPLRVPDQTQPLLKESAYRGLLSARGV